MQGENVLNPSTQEVFKGDTVVRATDPVTLPQPYASPADFAAQYPTPLDPTEFLAMCEEVSLLQTIPEVGTSLKQHTWREMTSLAFTSGSSYIAFADGECPEEYTHDGSNTTVTLKNLGAKKSLSISDIMHSQAVASANWNGIKGAGLPDAKAGDMVFYDGTKYDLVSHTAGATNAVLKAGPSAMADDAVLTWTAPANKATLLNGSDPEKSQISNFTLESCIIDGGTY